MEKRAVVDRIVERKHAVLLVGTEEKEMIIPADRLPEEAGEGSVLWLTFEYSGVEHSREERNNVECNNVELNSKERNNVERNNVERHSEERHNVELNNEQLSSVKATYVDGEDREETHQRIQSKMNRLQARKDSKFKKST